MLTLLKRTWPVLVILAMVVMGQPALAAGDAHDQAQNPAACLASRVIGMKVTDTSGAHVGKIRDLVLKPGEGEVSYAVLGVGGFVGMGGREFAVPLSAFTFEANRALLSVTISQLRDREGFHAWPRAAGTDWMVNAAQEAPVNNESDNPNMIPKDRLWAFRTSHLIGLPVIDRSGKDIGELEDFVMDARHTAFKYAVVSHGGVMGMGAMTSAVPVRALVIEADPRAVHFTGDIAKLEATRIDGNDSERFVADEGQHKRVDAQFTEQVWPKAFLTDAPALAGKGAGNMGWAAESEYNRMYKQDTEITVSGTVDSVGSFHLRASNASGMRVRLRAHDGNVLTVHAGPQSYMDKLGVDPHNGDAVTIVGSKVTYHGRSIIMARQIVLGSKAYDLRDKDGTPKWEMDEVMGAHGAL